MTTVKNYLSLIKFSHTIFAMPFAMIGFFLAVRMIEPSFSVLPGWHTIVLPNNFDETAISLSTKEVIVKLCLVIVCMILARSAAMAFNRYLDRHFDAKNPRTAIREIPAGIIKANSALWFTVISCLLFVGCCFFINSVCFFLSPVALLVVLGYSYTKRFTALCHLVLGL